MNACRYLTGKSASYGLLWAVWAMGALSGQTLGTRLAPPSLTVEARRSIRDGLNLPQMQIRDVTIVGAGPAGLAAAIAAKEAGLDYSIVEKGVLVNSIYKFPVNMVFFTTPELLEIGGLPLVSPFDKPTRIEALRYYRRVVDTYELAIEFGEQVSTVDGRGLPRVEISRSRRVRTKAFAGSVTAERDLRDRLFRSSQPHRRARRELAARVALLQRVARLLSKKRRHRRRRQLGGRNGARAVSFGRARDAGAPSCAAEAEHQILGAAGHRESASRKARSEGCSTRGRGNSADTGDGRARRAPERRYRPTRCSC